MSVARRGGVPNSVISTKSSGAQLGVLAVLLACIGARVCVSFEPIPYWDGDPTVLASPSSSLGPTASLLLDCVTLLASFAGFMSSPRERRASWVECGLVFVPLVAIWKHGFASVEDLRIGSAWLSAAVSALAIRSLCGEPRLRRVALAALTAVPVMLAVKGASQVFVEHPETVKAFAQTKDQFFASQGWTADSAAARAFERRLLQPEATGWFGLSNVYATFAAFGFVAFAGLVFEARRTRGWAWNVLLLGAAVGAFSVWLSQSKGGTGAAAIGVVLLVAGSMARRLIVDPKKGRIAGIAIGLGIVFLALWSVVARGLIGDRMGELSLWFRWFYMQGAARIFANNPLLGVGPAGFKDAYMLAKPALSPEEVTSPHSVLFDYASTLGVFGLAWCMWWLSLVARCGWGLLARPDVEEEESGLGSASGIENRVLFLVCAAATVVGAMTEREATTLDASLFRVGGMVLATIAAIAVRDTLEKQRAAVWVFGAAAIAVAVHAQIEVTAIWPNACAWVFGVLACCAEPVAKRTIEAGSKRLSATRPWAAMLAAVSVVLVAVRLNSVNTWEHGLRQAAEAVRVPTEFRARLEAIGTGRGTGDSSGALAADLSKTIGREIGDTLPAMSQAVSELQERAAGEALGLLTGAAKAVPDAGQTLRAAGRLSMQLAAGKAARGDLDAARDDALRAEQYALQACKQVRSRSASNSWLGTILVSRADLLKDPEALAKAAQAWERAAGLDPFGINAPVKLSELYRRTGDSSKAAEWARKALDRDSELRLDPLVGLTAAQRAELMKLARGS